HPLPTMSNPQQFPQPPHIKHYLFTQKHNPPLHTNSPIPNKAPYNLIQPIPKSKSQQIYYPPLTQYLTTNSNFKHSKHPLYQPPKHLY
ncbi:M4 family metallopeptidase, partial [Staphylococcus aureus]|uniref:M4 family metallopeptidase n=1 Tax=Staphylococcus aureus TaxID=1280 RepID=UPI0016430D29